MTAAIEARNVARSFGTKAVVIDASLSVAPGSITALVGPNGSGKTTLMLMLATLLRPDSGEIRIAGHDPLRATAAARAQLGWMPDTLGSWGTLTVRETLFAVCRMYGLTADTANTRTQELLAIADLGQLAGQRTNTLSRGQKQRLSLARAYAHQPSVLLLDEPASGLDPEARLAQRASLSRLAERGVAVLVTSHVLDELEQLATDVVLMRDGRTVSAELAAQAAETTRWRVRATDPEALLAALASAGVAAERRGGISGDHVVVLVAGEAGAASLLRNLITTGIDVIEYAPLSGTLERAFMGSVRAEEDGA
ncbi:ABC transporter ATP-binding protein [Leucobacter sp. CSA2]|uniref:ABC transporter ATP-binding protein n=1 Tax=Leucobacter edaphi TaxID=2796472 RepID=A0A934QFB8_9MICO|nr:ABC transporter ATP-binding protein [Leucobacter edaphi]MBK0422517.1 ABC transporter ATP-binding protein [Leucobacter edaphi]